MAELQALITQQWPDLQVEQPLGSGACGTVFACTRKSETTGIESKEAVKVVEVLFPEAAHRRAEEDGIPFEEYYQRIKAEKSREIELLIALKSPHIVHINEFRAVETPDRSAFYLLILMDRLAPLDTLRAAHGQDTPEQAAALAKKVCLDLCEALRVCHENGVCHRDIKPANILYGTTGDFYLGDFGVSQYAAAPESTLTSSGTSRYAAPEQLTGQADFRSDLYSLGLVLYELVNHWRAPFLPAYPARLTAGMRYEALSKRLSGAPLPPPDNCPPELAKIILKLCAPAPEDRWQTVQELTDALSAAPASPAAAPAAAVPPRPERTESTEKAKKHPGRRFVPAVCLAAAAVVLGLSLLGRFRYRQSTGTDLTAPDLSAWAYAAQNSLIAGEADAADLKTHYTLAGGAYFYPVGRTSGLYQETDGVTDWGAAEQSADVTGVSLSEPDADGNVTYTITCTAQAEGRYTLAADAGAFAPGADLQLFTLMDLRTGYTFPFPGMNRAALGLQDAQREATLEKTFTYQGKSFTVSAVCNMQWLADLPELTDMATPGTVQLPLTLLYTYTVTVPQELDSLALYLDKAPYTAYPAAAASIGVLPEEQPDFSGLENYVFLPLTALAEKFAAAPGTEAPATDSYLARMGASFSTETSFTVPNGALSYLTNPSNDFYPLTDDDLGEGNFLISSPADASVTITGVTRSGPDASGNVTYLVTFDTTATLQYGFSKQLYDDGTLTAVGLGRCFSGFGLMDGQTGTVLAPQQGDGSWPWSVPYLAYNSYTCHFRQDATQYISPTRGEPSFYRLPTTVYTRDDAPDRTLTYAETAAWDFGKTETGQGFTTTADGQRAAIVAIYHDTTMHGALQIKVNADADDLVLYYNQQPYLYGTAYPYSFWDCAGWTGTFRLDEMYNLLGMPYLRFYRLRDLADRFAAA